MYENLTFEYAKNILSIVKKILNLFYQTYLIAGDDTCQCIHWRKCRWSNAAVFSVVGVAQESEEFKEVRKMIQQYTCDGPEDNYVTCCGHDQKPSEDDPLIDKIGNSYLVHLIKQPILQISNFNFPNFRCCKVFFIYFAYIVILAFFDVFWS